MVTKRYFPCTVFLITVIFMTWYAADSHAGNKKMMEKNADELIMLNTMMLRELGTIQKDGKIILTGDVLHRDGKIIIKLNQIRQIESPGDEKILSPENFNTDDSYQIFLREDTLSEIPIPTENPKNN